MTHIEHTREIMNAIQLVKQQQLSVSINARRITTRINMTSDVLLMTPVLMDEFEVHGSPDVFLELTAPVTRGEMQMMMCDMLLNKDLSEREKKQHERVIRDHMHLLKIKLYQRLQKKVNKRDRLKKKVDKSQSHLTIWATENKYSYNKSRARRDFVRIKGMARHKFRRNHRHADIVIAGQVQTFMELIGFKEFVKTIDQGVIRADHIQKTSMKAVDANTVPYSSSTLFTPSDSVWFTGM